MIFLFATGSCSTSWSATSICSIRDLDVVASIERAAHRTRGTGLASKIHWRDQPSLAHIPAHAAPTGCHSEFLSAGHAGSIEDDLVAQDRTVPVGCPSEGHHL